MAEPGRRIRKAAVAVTGGTVVTVGVILIPLPGPGTLIVAGGLAILATEFDGARRALDRLKSGARRVLGRSTETPTPQPDPTEPG